MENNNYYVYAYIRKDYNTIFYVGKGRNNRCNDINNGRNDYFKNIVKSTSYEVVKLFENLDEETAFELENKVIKYLVDDLKYSIEILGYKKIKGRHLVNMSFGGEGSSGIIQSEKTKNKRRMTMLGKKKHEGFSEIMRKVAESRGPMKDEVKRKIAVSCTGRKDSEETRRKKSESGKIVQGKPEQRKINSEAVKAAWENSEMIKNQKEAKMKKVNQNAIYIF